MVYIEYERLKRQYRQSQRRFEAIISEKEKLFQMTQPQGINTDQEKVTGGNPKNNFDKYLILKEEKRIEERLSEAKALVAEREELLNIKKAELYQSKDPEDVIYRLRFIERATVRRIAFNVNYSERQVFRMLKKINSLRNVGR